MVTFTHKGVTLSAHATRNGWPFSNVVTIGDFSSRPAGIARRQARKAKAAARAAQLEG